MVVDTIIILSMLLSILFGYKRGLVGVAFKIVSFLIAILISLILYYPISNFIIEHTQIDDSIENSIVYKFSNEKEQDMNKDENSILSNYVESYTKEVTDTGIKMVAQNVARTIVNLAVLILLYVVTRFILLLFRSISDKLADIPIIKQFNKTGGILYGILRGFLVIYLILAVISLCAPFMSNLGVIHAINQSMIGNMMYKNNVILKLFF